MILSIKDVEMEAKINTKGGELISIFKSGEEYLWQGDPQFWSGQSPLLFPIVGHLKDDAIKIRGQECKMGVHGFIKGTEFDVECHTENKLVLSTKYTEATLLQYPFRFRFAVAFQIEAGRLQIEYTIENLDDVELVYNFGLHPGFRCDLFEGDCIENYYIEFPKEVTLDSAVFTPEIRVELQNKKRIVDNSKQFWFVDAVFARTLIFENVDFDAVWLCHKEKGRILHLQYTGFPMFWIVNPFLYKFLSNYNSKITGSNIAQAPMQPLSIIPIDII
ncbi:MAG: hypothetical protein R3Y53_09250, partial [Bacillota bacterium]